MAEILEHTIFRFGENNTLQHVKNCTGPQTTPVDHGVDMVVKGGTPEPFPFTYLVTDYGPL